MIECLTCTLADSVQRMESFSEKQCELAMPYFVKLTWQYPDLLTSAVRIKLMSNDILDPIQVIRTIFKPGLAEGVFFLTR